MTNAADQSAGPLKRGGWRLKAAPGGYAAAPLDARFRRQAPCRERLFNHPAEARETNGPNTPDRRAPGLDHLAAAPAGGCLARWLRHTRRYAGAERGAGWAGYPPRLLLSAVKALLSERPQRLVHIPHAPSQARIHCACS